MNPTVDDDAIPPAGDPLAEALAWFARLRDGPIAPAQRAEFEAWLAADPRHAEAYARVERLWQAPELTAALGHFAAAERPPAPRRVRPRRWAAAAAVFWLAGWSLSVSGLIDRWRADYTTLAGEQRRIPLADGSTVTLNTDSALALDFGSDRRGVRLLAGEAYFEVRTDPTRPFLVRTRAGIVRVVGTRFAVRAGATTEVSVESGIVTLGEEQGAEVRVGGGQRATLSERGVTPPEPFEPGREFAWLKGRLIFRDQPLARVLAEIDRYHAGTILIADPKLADTLVSGNYKLRDTAALIRALAETAGGRVFTLSRYLTLVH